MHNPVKAERNRQTQRFRYANELGDDALLRAVTSAIGESHASPSSRD
ncbi:hypothetical protein PC123_g20641 [Phytophthora cactorum]|nr:hypothetical protein PC123_g20641 [Phytophthora cactorum]